MSKKRLTTPKKKSVWIRTDLSKEYFEMIWFKKEANAPRVTKVFFDGSIQEMRLKRKYFDKKKALAEVNTGKKLTELGIETLDAERIGRRLVEKHENWPGICHFLYPEIKGRKLSDILEEAFKTRNYKALNVLEEVGKQDSLIFKTGLEKRNSDLLRIEIKPEHILVGEKGEIKRIDLEPISHMAASSEYSKIKRLWVFTCSMIDSIHFGITRQKHSQRTHNKLINLAITKYLKGIKTHLTEPEFEEYRERVVGRLKLYGHNII